MSDQKAHLYHRTNVHGSDIYTVVDRSGQIVLETQDSDAADQKASEYPEIIGCENHPSREAAPHLWA